ncbi:MAG: hypothetical protein JXR70_10455 [Spirochaetales bacterium]|nr:hypothetical protein [Spirochaetales bacterium]
MKNIFNKVAFTCVFLLISINNQAQTPSDAVDYMNELGVATEELKNETWRYLKAITRGKSARKVEKKRQQLVSGLKGKKGEVLRTKGFTKDCQYKKAVVDYLDLSYTVLKEDFDKILDMEEIAEQSFDLMEAYITAKEKANDKLDNAFDDLQIAQEVFAAQNNITLVEGEMDKKSQKIKNANKALEYYNDIYLIFFKSFKQEAYVLDAYQRSDINAMEQNINSLIQFNQEGFQKIDETDNYNGDGTLKVVAKQMLTFYDQEANRHFPKVVDFFMAKDKFEKLNKVMESKKKKDITKEEIENFNEAVKEYNKAVKEVNEVNETMNALRAQKLDLWNSQVENYFDRHTN